jgi:apoptosis-inducing factor 2
MKMVNGSGDLAEYEPFGTAIMVPIGPEGGSGQLPGQEELTSRETVASVKGRDLMVDRYEEFFGSTTSVSS